MGKYESVGAGHMLSNVANELAELNANFATLIELLKKGVPSVASTIEKTEEATTPKQKARYITAKSPLSLSEAFPRKCVRPVREGEEPEFTFDTIEDAVLDLFQHGIAPQDIDVYLTNGQLVNGTQYLQ